MLTLGAVLASCAPDGGASSNPDAAAEPGEAAARPVDRRVPDAAGAVAAPAPVRAATRENPTTRVVFVGTSLTAGLGLLREGERFTDRVQALADSSGIAVEVVNAGVSGDTSAGGLRRIEWLLEEPVDVLVVELGANDGLRGLPVDALESNLEGVIRSTREAYPEARVVLAGMEAPPNMGPRYTEAFKAVFPRVARAQDAVLVPFLLEGVAGVRAMNQDDGIHPNAAGHEAVARTLWSVLEPILRSAAEPGS